jgi:hypothetical protein
MNSFALCGNKCDTPADCFCYPPFSLGAQHKAISGGRVSLAFPFQGLVCRLFLDMA